ncbi:MAG: N-acetylmuramoyl-L-alanine amidase [Anaerosolibacter sp.]|uniref:peptidoglycan recognition protein family protein n=1 Tax=Anaerosolibacter sp. TaxID=1872527 RepID=UPI00261AADAF|nr:N-acetylmuramoyl-L-alanine amidase [Anaerosolibacter sp.]MDF2546159.1 N-acetylmuramoyl-L-alanine amidase [Anaerosolibacter sp.]
MYKYIIDHIPKTTPCNRRPGTNMEPETITLHNTGNPNSNAKGERGWLTNGFNKRTASFHIAIDENEAIECLPLNEAAWHAGDGANGPGNRKSIGIEACESGDQVKVWKNAVHLVAKLLYERGWGTDRVRTHQSWSGKNCPRLILPKWKEFIQDIEKQLKELQQSDEKEKARSEASSWAVEAHKWVKEKGISDGTNPKDSVTREQVWVMLYNFFKLVRGGK